MTQLFSPQTSNSTQQFLQRHVVHGPDHVAIQGQIQVHLLQEVYLKAFAQLPLSLFNEAPFSPVHFDSEAVHLPTEQFLRCAARLSGAFRNDPVSRQQIVDAIHRGLTGYEQALRRAEQVWDETQHLPAEQVKRLLDWMVLVDGFAAFNMYLPRQWYPQKLTELGLTIEHFQVDTLLASLVVPHRIQVRQLKLKLALEWQMHGQLVTALSDDAVQQVLKYDGFEQWLFDDQKLTDPRLLEREIRQLARHNSVQDIQQELQDQHLGRQRRLQARQDLLADVAGAVTRVAGPQEARSILESMVFLSVVATEEEQRHMLEARHLVLLGRIIRSLDLDPGRCSIAELMDAAHMRWS